MDVDALEAWDSALRVRHGERRRIASLGFCFYATDELCTYAETPDELEIALGNPHVSVILTTPALAPDDRGDKTLFLSEDPARAFMELHNHLATETGFYGGREPSRVHPDARVHPSAWIDPHGVTVEAGVVVEPFACIYEGVHLEAGVKVCAGAVLGCDAIQTRRFGDTAIQLVHRGGVRVARGAEIGVHAVVCAGIFNSPTYVGRRAYVGPHVVVGHEVAVGHDAQVLASAVLFGSCEIEDGACVAPGALVSNGVTVGEASRVSPGSLVTRDVEARTKVTGYFAIEHGRFLERFRREHALP